MSAPGIPVALLQPATSFHRLVKNFAEFGPPNPANQGLKQRENQA